MGESGGGILLPLLLLLVELPSSPVSSAWSETESDSAPGPCLSPEFISQFRRRSFSRQGITARPCDETRPVSCLPTQCETVPIRRRSGFYLMRTWRRDIKQYIAETESTGKKDPASLLSKPSLFVIKNHAFFAPFFNGAPLQHIGKQRREKADREIATFREWTSESD